MLENNPKKRQTLISLQIRPRLLSNLGSRLKVESYTLFCTKISHVLGWTPAVLS